MTDSLSAVESRAPGASSPTAASPREASNLAHDHDQTGRALSRLVVVTLTIYLVVTVAIVTARGVWVTPDVLAVFIAIGAMLVGRGVLFIRDWLPFIAILLAWEAMRGLADGFGMAVHSDDILAVEQFLFFGFVPTVVLQDAFFRAGQVAWYDVFFSLLYGAHFAFPIVIAWVFWLRDRGMYFRFVASLMLMALAGFVLYVLIPVAPPRFSADYGALNLGIHDVMKETLTLLDKLPLASWTYANISPNPVAAFPSLHAAFPILALLFVRRRFPKVAFGVAVYTALMWYGIVYLGHHYVVDIIGGVALAVGTYWLVIHRGLLDRAFRRLARAPQPTNPAV